ncbi:MAG: hypothetical protein CM15mP103_04150 [Gammaproteobacteria bacterium]|nr:MAG: hypothetical protein CM15mP103_04150 [Gammaproteobacteria bacterium]
MRLEGFGQTESSLVFLQRNSGFLSTLQVSVSGKANKAEKEKIWEKGKGFEKRKKEKGARVIIRHRALQDQLNPSGPLSTRKIRRRRHSLITTQKFSPKTPLWKFGGFREMGRLSEFWGQSEIPSTITGRCRRHVIWVLWLGVWAD